MKKPEGTIDLIGTGMQLGLGIIDLVKEFSPSPEQRSINKKNRKIKVAVRRLKHRFRNVPVETYVKINFANETEQEQQNIINYIKPLL